MKDWVKTLSASLLQNASDANRKAWARRITTENIPPIVLLDLLQVEGPVSNRSMWLIGDVCDLAPDRMRPYLIDFFQARSFITLDGYERSLAKMFCRCGIPEAIEGEVATELFRWLRDPGSSISTKNFAMQALFDLSQKHRELKYELRLIIQSIANHYSEAFRKRAHKYLSAL